MSKERTFDRLERNGSMIPGFEFTFLTKKINLSKLYELASNKKRVKRAAKLRNNIGDLEKSKER